MPWADPEELGRRIRAALIVGGKSLEEVAPELNVSARTLTRTIAGERQAREWELGRIAELTGVPEWFLRDGFAGQPSAEDVADRQLDAIATDIAAIARQLDVADLPARLAALEREISRLRADVTPGR